MNGVICEPLEYSFCGKCMVQLSCPWFTGCREFGRVIHWQCKINFLKSTARLIGCMCWHLAYRRTRRCLKMLKRTRIPNGLWILAVGISVEKYSIGRLSSRSLSLIQKWVSTCIPIMYNFTKAVFLSIDTCKTFWVHDTTIYYSNSNERKIEGLIVLSPISRVHNRNSQENEANPSLWAKVPVLMTYSLGGVYSDLATPTGWTWHVCWSSWQHRKMQHCFRVTGK